MFADVQDTPAALGAYRRIRGDCGNSADQRDCAQGLGLP